jgi:5-methylcytosine-specific restriction endonuclease McrA
LKYSRARRLRTLGTGRFTCIELPNAVTGRGRCDEHRTAPERNRCRSRRDLARERNSFYARKHWAMVRRCKLLANPICELCNERLANEVHHRTPLEQGAAEYDRENLVSTCKPCHSRETRREHSTGVGRVELRSALCR